MISLIESNRLISQLKCQFSYLKKQIITLSEIRPLNLFFKKVYDDHVTRGRQLSHHQLMDLL